MKSRSRIRFNPDTKEIEGSETFVKTYFDKIQEVILGASSTTVEEPRAVKVRTAIAILRNYGADGWVKKYEGELVRM